jgi:flagellar hook-associated protein 1
MSLIGALNSGLTGILANQKAVEITGNNIANVNTPGYSRQVAMFSPKSAINIQGHLIGQGVKLQEITREYDQFVSGQLVNQNNILGKESAKNGPLAELERVLNVGTDSLASDIERFFGAWHDLSQNPSGHVERDRVIYEGENLLGSFEQTKGELVQIRQNINISLSANVDEINSKLKEIAALNADIQSKETLGHVANLDHDRRDLLVNDISRLIGAQVYQAGGSQIGLQLPGGVPLVEGNYAADFEAYYEGDSLRFQVKMGDVTIKAGNDNFGGEIRGFLDIRDDFIPRLENNLDSLQYNLVTHVNNVHEAGYNPDGLTGQSFFSKPLSYQSETGFDHPEDDKFQTGKITVNGKEITINDENNSLNGIRDAINNSEAGVLASVVYDGTQYRLELTPKTHGDDVTFTSELTDGVGFNFNNEDGDPEFLDRIPGVDKAIVKITSTQQVAAAGVTQGAPGDNRNALAIYSLLTSQVVNGKETFVESYGRISSTVGTESKRNAMALGGAMDTMTQLENMRESIVGVSLEQEIINLTLFQRGFEAAATYVSTVDEMMSTVLNMKR